MPRKIHGTMYVDQVITGGVTIDSSTTAVTGLTATATELNKNAGVTAGTAAASKTAVLGANKNLDTLVLPVSGLKIGSGAGTAVTSSAAELNILTGVTATAAELSKNAGVTAGTAAASKTAVLGASKNLDILGLPVSGLKIGVAGAEVVVTPSAAELNKNTGIPAAAYQTVAAEVTFTETSGAGTYTGSVTVPAGATILDIQVQSTALWTNAGTATMTVGDTDDDGWYTAIDLKATDLLLGEVIRFGSTGGKEGVYIVTSTGLLSASYSASQRLVTGIVITSSTAGGAGRTRMLVIFVTATPTAAVKV